MMYFGFLLLWFYFLLFHLRCFVSVCNVQHLEDRQEVAGMIQALTKGLIQPLGEPEQGPEGVELLLLMEEEKKSPSALRRVFEGDSDQESFYGFQEDDN